MPTVNDYVYEISIKRNIIFSNNFIRFGGLNKRETMWIVRALKTICEKGLMGENFLVKIKTINFSGVIYYDYLKLKSFVNYKNNSYEIKKLKKWLN